jgi:hypothetical protein
MIEPGDLCKKELLELLTDAAKNWLAHDGLWFQEVEKKHDMAEAIELDKNAWQKFTVIEARRIMKRLNIVPGGGISSLAQALKFRLYAFINVQTIEEMSEDRCVFTMNRCRVQEARKRKGLPDFPCKPVGIVEYEYFAKTIDERIETRCLACPPDAHPDDHYCRWEFTIKK